MERAWVLPRALFSCVSLLCCLLLISAGALEAQTLSEDISDTSDIELEADEIIAIQQGLAARGYYEGDIDGIIGVATRQAVRRYQGFVGVAIDGIIDANLAERIQRPLPAPEDFESFRECDDVCPEMIVLPGVDFTPGMRSGDMFAEPDEAPGPPIALTRFAIGRREVTFDQWAACVADGGCRGNPFPDDEGWGRETRPVINVSWTDAQDYVAWLNRVAGMAVYRLPSEAEWEYAAWGGIEAPTLWDSAEDAAVSGNFGQPTCCKAGKIPPDEWFETAPAGQFKENGFGLWDMGGNVWEWTADCWRDDYTMPLAEECDARARRGGSWYYPFSFGRPSNRGRQNALMRDSENGFRVLRELP